MAEEALLQDLAPKYFAGMHRAAIHSVDRLSPGIRVYYAAYESQSVPRDYIAVTIERFPKSQNASEHFEEFANLIPSYDSRNVVDEEFIPGGRIKRIFSTQVQRAFWASANDLIVIAFVTPPPFERALLSEWLRRRPSSIGSLRTETSVK